MKLFICEKPSQAKDIAWMLGSKKRAEHHFEGGTALITWCVGHLLELAPPEHYCPDLKPWRMQVLPIIPQQWVLKAQEKTKKQLAAIGKLLKRTREVVIATDADREGDVIGRELLDYFNYQGKIERLWLSALDETSIKKALSTLKTGESTANLYQAGLARQRADWLVGMNLTMATSCLFGRKGEGVLSVGRVQTPTLKLIVDRDSKIEKFKSQDYYLLKASFLNAEKEVIKANCALPEDVCNEDGRCLDREKINTICEALANQKGLVSDFSEKDKKSAAPLCLSLSALQKIASAQFSLSAKESLDAAQSLYEKHKASTYPRSDCPYLPDSQFKDASVILAALANTDEDLSALVNLCQPAFKSKVWNDEKITAHHAIIPTANTGVDIKAMTMTEKKIYGLICRYYLAQFFGDYEYSERKALISVQGYAFKASCKKALVSGWRAAIQGMEDKNSLNTEESEEDENNALPTFIKKEILTINQLNISACKTKPLARFTEGTLISAMKAIALYVEDASLKKILNDNAGLGTEATRANILETLVSREYILRQGKHLISSAKGRELIALLPKSISNPATTAIWEQELERIAQGKSELSQFLEEQADMLQGMLQQLKNSASKTGDLA